jgi:transcriptional regulator with XRE-family HTH domain
MNEKPVRTCPVPGHENASMERECVEVPRRIKELREILEISVMDMAADTGISQETYAKYESGELDIPISTLYHIANRMGTDVTVLITGEDPKMASAAVCRKGKGVQIERYPGYEFSSLAYNFKGRVMEPLLVFLDSSRPPAALVSHIGQEFNYVVEGQVKVTVGKAEYVLSEGDSIYFDARLPHGQSALNGQSRFITIIQE